MKPNKEETKRIIEEIRSLTQDRYQNKAELSEPSCFASCLSIIAQLNNKITNKNLNPMKTITFNDLLTDPKYREMDEEELKSIFSANFDNDEFNKSRKYFNLIIGESLSEALFNHLQKLKSESEKKAEPENMVFKDYEKVFDMFFKPINKPVTFTPTKKPPLGITPKTIHQEMVKKERFGDLQRAITRYLENGLPINIEWIKEYNELI